MTRRRSDAVRLLISCPDRPGIVAGVSRFLYEHGANILDASQHSTDPAGGTFFMRMVFDAADLDLSVEALEQAFDQAVGLRFGMTRSFARSSVTKRMAILVSKVDHCLLELLWRWRSGDLDATIPMIVSNHDTLREEVEPFGIPFHHLPIAVGREAEQEAAVGDLLAGNVDLIVLARYMRILSPAFVARHPGRILNIHHSFLPAFVGANPYRRAYERGVKLIGATAHYVTDDLDQGPIVDQDVVRVSHRETPQDLARLGREVERLVLARAVRSHLEDRILIHGNKTIVFD